MMRIRAEIRWPMAALVALVLGFAEAAGAQSLVEVARQADREVLAALVERGEDVTVRSGDGTSALHWASYWDDVEAAEMLIVAGADVNAANDLGATPLWPAALNGSSEMVRLLLSAGADARAALLSGETLVMTAARSGNPDVVEQLLRKGGDPNGSATRGQTALMWAVAQRHADVVALLLEHGADVHARSDVWKQYWQTDGGEVVHPELRIWIDHGGNTPLLFAAHNGDLESAKLLVAAGADVEAEAAYGINAAVYAVHSGNNELLEFLLEQGTDPSAAAAGYSALHAALLRRNPGAVRLLLEHGADPNAPLATTTPTRRASSDFYFHPAYVGATPFWLAARFSQPDAMRLLAEHGADPHFVHDVDYWASTGIFTGFNRDTQGETTALMAAVGMGGGRGFVAPAREERERLMLEAVAIAADLRIDVNAVNANGASAADAAAAAGFQSVVDFLIARGARPPVPAPRRTRPEETDDQ
ncbi:MAG TPA: ankyrin repeat domain-containing protein [Longimicrobiaceae bacterium]|nr:ankyrin repeat domain-containing protein [Longimicrobiaceae bacterium]